VKSPSTLSPFLFEKKKKKKSSHLGRAKGTIHPDADKALGACYNQLAGRHKAPHGDMGNRIS
jgi:hypothetical protein